MIRAVIFDLDNTLVAYGCSVPDPAVVAHLRNLAQAGISTVILSNATSRRSREVAAVLGVAHIGNAHKPALSGFRRALAALRSEPARTVVVGDQVFRDILGARRAGCQAILVRPISQQDFPGTKLLRLPEALLTAHLKRHGKWPGPRLPKLPTVTC